MDRVLSLPEAIVLALRNHPGARQAHAGSDLASARVDETRAAYLPQLMFTGQYQRTTANTVVRPGVNSSPAQQEAVAAQEASWRPSFNSFSLTGSASQLIYDFGQTSGRAQASQASFDAATTSEWAVQIQIVSAVRRAYFQARAQKDLARVGLTAQAVDQALYDTFGQRQVAVSYGPLNYYRVVEESIRGQQTGDESLRRVFVPAPGDAQVPLSERWRLSAGPRQTCTGRLGSRAISRARHKPSISPWPANHGSS